MEVIRSATLAATREAASDDRDAGSAAPVKSAPLQAPRYFNHLVIDDFLPRQLQNALLAYALDNCETFLPAKVVSHRYSDAAFDASYRRSWYCPHGLGELTVAFRDAVKSALLPQVWKLGIPEFALSGLELELVAHRDGSFFRRHIDTATQSARDKLTSDRVVTAVYYFHATPKQFTGGELALAPLGPGELRLIEPQDNRLVAFASVAPHEVLPVVCPANEFSHARFAVNIWLHRARREAA